jgi:protein-S-isoprenylcysteine O-methyltransferase Ste14
MFWFLVPLLTGFAFNWASAFTHFYSGRFGDRGGRAMTFVTRNILGIPIWAFGVIWAMREPAPVLFEPGSVLEILAWLLIVLGTVVMVWALVLLRTRSFRPTDKDTIVARSIYEHLRHPIYSGLLADFVAFALMRPSIPVLTACGLGWIFVFVQARLEEMDLRQRIPEYSQAMARVPRFFPRLKKRVEIA